ncbi:hypothetical protein FD47_GL002826 [Lentilactobacillus parafarraginis DSM 18390 = JCM 14109]|jgi:hypothetical protein|uniref:AbrB family transcriptional regulator n=1 Tax=Lentilactobacillus parafarraginis DSM 18390 = JCM 14109 TaxID=1423786 RepID=A0A0R1YL48_9LACO|nr:hypothetical protein FD47_GL002826 [Lentilactobacillus parafarraginis DSM 18390 = JCM 14109]
MILTKKRSERVLGEFSTRKTGNSLTLTVPKAAGVPAGKRFVLVAKDDGTLEYRAVHGNPWLDGEYDDIDFRAELNDVGNYGQQSPIGKERVDW